MDIWLLVSFGVGAGLGVGGAVFVAKQHLEKLRTQLDNVQGQQLSDKDKELKDFQALCAQEFEQRDRAIAEANAEIALRERELNLLDESDVEFAAAGSTSELWLILLKIIGRVFGSDAVFVGGFGAGQQGAFISSGSLSRDDIKLFEIIQPMVRKMQKETAPRPTIMPASDASTLNELLPAAAQLAIFPVIAEDILGMAFVVFGVEVPQEQIRLLRKLVERFGRVLRRLTLYEDETKSSRIDFLTGLPNNKYLNELLPHLLQGAHSDRPLSCILVEGDNLKGINDKYGHRVGDQMVKELVEMLQNSSRIEGLNSDRRPSDHYFRFGGLQFLMVAEDTDADLALNIAERLRAAVEKRLDWPGGVPRWSVSIGIATAPDDSKDKDMLVAQADVALMYVKDKLGSNQAVNFHTVPRSYRVTKLSAKVGGTLDIFDPSTILKSIANSDKTGILTVTSGERKFWGFFENRKLLKAHLGSFRGNQAAIEFLSTFEDGNFVFQEYNQLSTAALEGLHQMDASFDVTKSVETILMDGALAEDKLASARKLLTNVRMFARPGARAAEIFAKLPAMPEPPDESEIEVMRAICRYVNGRTMLVNIFERLDGAPTYLRWHSAAMLVRHKIIELSKLGMSFSV